MLKGASIAAACALAVAVFASAATGPEAMAAGPAGHKKCHPGPCPTETQIRTGGKKKYQPPARLRKR